MGEWDDTAGAAKAHGPGRLLTRRRFTAYLGAAAGAALLPLGGCVPETAGGGNGPVPDPAPEPPAADTASPFPTARIAVLGDLHVDAGFDLFVAHTRAAFAAIARIEPPPDAIVIDGDMANHGLPEEYDLVEALAAEAGLAFPDDFILAMGDHEQWGRIAEGEPEDFAGQRELFLRRAGRGSLYHDLAVNGEHIIVLGPDADPQSWPCLRLSDAQLEWLDGLVAADDARGRRSFVFLHAPADDTVAYTFEGEQKHGTLESGAALREVLSGRGNAVLITAHAHSPADFRRPDPAGPLYVACPAVAYLRPDAHAEWSEEGLACSGGLLMDIYPDRTEFISWDFVLDAESGGGDYTAYL